MDRPAGARLAEHLLNGWQRGFPLVSRPFAHIGQVQDATESEVIDACARLLDRGVISRIGGVWAPGAGGASVLCAIAAPPDRLQAVAELVSAHPGVNHNYEREHALNLWFVATATDAARLDGMLAAIGQASGLPVLRMKMMRPYRIDLGFDLGLNFGADARRPVHADCREGCEAVAPSPAGGGQGWEPAAVPLATAAGLHPNLPPQGEGAQPPDLFQRPAPGVEARHQPLAALAEAGLPLAPEPFAAWAARLDCTAHDVLRQLQVWLRAGTLRRFGLVVRHHEVGFAANAMTVFDAPDGQVDALGVRLAAQPGITLCYRRQRAAGWRYNLYCMVHGRSRDETLALVHAAIAGAGLDALPREVLFSRRRFKQTGPSYFRT
ncbi:MAG: hypothetical protein FWG56_04370 [Desulfovibrionaceae bacterium]|jgi:DNA-binding Lrp family transcriptional regulator|nr:hypothetical protein [Desulfovibrionaceae bacterium]